MLYCGRDFGNGEICDHEHGACGQCCSRHEYFKASVVKHGDSDRIEDMLNEKPLSEEAQIKKDRGEKYGDFQLNMEAFTMCIEAMVMQATQQRIKLPKYFGALVMCKLKALREVYQHDPDNGKDHFNYLEVAREMGYEK